MSDLPLSPPQSQFTNPDTVPPQNTAFDHADDSESDSIVDAEQERPLFPTHQCTALSQEWQSIQAGFVDSPRASVEKADALVRKTIDILSNSFSDMRNSLEQTWEKDKEVSTEELRLAFQNYRSFFQRLLSL